MKLVLVHGSGGSAKFWHYQTERFTDCDAIDLPGHPEGEPCTSVDDYVEWLRGYLKERGYQDVVLAGHSLGGAIAMLYGLKYPQELKALILIDTGARLRVNPDYLSSCGDGIEDIAAWLRNWEPRYALVSPDVRELLLKEKARVGPAVQLNDFLCCDKFDVIDRVHQIRLPTLVLCGSEDAMTPVKYSRYLADKIEGARLLVITGATHLLPAERPQEVNKAIEEFLSSL